MKSSIKNRVIRALSPLGVSARVLIAVALAGAGISACDVHGISSPGTLAAIEVTPNATIAASSSLQMVAVGRDADGRVLAIAPTWSAAAGGTITSAGIFSAGTVTGVFANNVVASVGAISGSATITVTSGAIVTITVVPNPVTLAVTGTQQFVAVAKDAGGNIVQFTPTWSVVAGGGSIDAVGNFTAGGAIGTYTNTVQASTNGIKGFATVVVTAGPVASITVTPNPDTLAVGAKQQFVAIGKDASGNNVAMAAVWSVAANGGAVDANGMFTAGATPGTFTNTVKATSGSLSGTATVVVTAGALASIKVTPNPDTLAINGTQQFIATGNDAAGNPIVITPVWAVVAGGGVINATGLFTAGTVSGTFTSTVRATSGGFTGFATVVVNSGPLASITVTPNPAIMPTNSTQQFVATGKDANGNVVAMAPVWSVANGGGAINPLGMFTAGGVAGTYNNTIKASSGAIAGFATVTVTSGPLATITVTPNPVTMAANTTQQFVATGTDAGGNPVALAPVWSVANGGGAISPLGLFTAGAVAGTYNNTIKATSGGISGFATVTVTAIIPPPSPLGTAANFGIISGAAISCGTPGTPGGVSGATTPANLGSGNATYVGFPPGGPCTLDGVIAAPGVVATAQGDLTTAYLAAQGMLGCTDLSGVDLGFYNALNPLPPGCYKFSTSAALTGTLQLTGSAAAKWTFQIGSTLTTSVGANVIMAGGAIADNVYWAVGSSATIGTNANFSGNIMSLAAITLNAGATLNGRALAQTAGVDMIQGGSHIIKP